MTARDTARADAVYAALLQRQGEQWVQPRIERTRRVLEYLDDPQRTYRVVHVTGTNGKTSTSRIAESLLRSLGLRTGLFTSPQLERFTERIMIDGEPSADAQVADAWEDTRLDILRRSISCFCLHPATVRTDRPCRRRICLERGCRCGCKHARR